jgi:hypothetical protein
MSRFSFRDGDPTSEGVSWPDVCLWHLTDINLRAAYIGFEG